MKKPIYLDFNATTPIDAEVADAMLPYLHEIFGNPSSTHIYGTEAKRAVEKARGQVAGMLGCSIDEIIFTSGGSESNNYAIKGVVNTSLHKGNHIITSQIEHPAVSEVCEYLEQHGFRVTYLPVDSYGCVDPGQLEEAITPQTILITVMHANNEVGTIQSIAEMTKISRSHGIIFHSDCAQSAGKIPVNVAQLQVDMASIAGHKLYAPKGVGALYVRSGVLLEKMIHGAAHEMNRRAGTENVLAIVALGKACELITQNLAAYQAHMKKMRDRLEDQLKTAFPEIKINGHPERRLPNTCSISFPRLEANTILAQLKDIAASAGAACHSDRIDVSHVLNAMGIPEEYAMGTVRFSVGRGTTVLEIDRAFKKIQIVVQQLSSHSTPPAMSGETGQYKLTQYTHGLGCACKLRPQLLEEVLQSMPLATDKQILVGAETADDAAVYRINDQLAIVQTVDFFTPIVDEPYHFGAIAAANSLSDVYAMGGKPLFALNIVGFPSNRLPISVLQDILRGAQEKADEAGVSIIGGHTVDDTEPKFGLAVTGVIHPRKIVRNSTAKPGDALILTKPVGTGILSTALKMGLLDTNLSQRLISTMSTLNKTAAEVMLGFKVNACTDITGFGLLGHLLEMLKGARASAAITFDFVPFLPEVHALITGNVVPGGTSDNFSFTEKSVKYPSDFSRSKKLMLNDAQTSGGLLIAIPNKTAPDLLDRLLSMNVPDAQIIGEVIPDDTITIRIL